MTENYLPTLLFASGVFIGGLVGDTIGFGAAALVFALIMLIMAFSKQGEPGVDDSQARVIEKARRRWEGR